METIDRYLRAVRPLLPKAERDDIVAELSEEILSQVADREAILGRPLAESEVDEILGRFGHPMVVGGRYQPPQGSLVFGRELIGRDLFPFYVGTLKVTFALSTAIHVAIMAALSLWRLVDWGDVLGSFALHFTIQFAVLTAVFCAIQSQVTRHPGLWEPEKAAPDRTPSAGSVRFESVAEVVVLAFVLPWLLAVLGASPVEFGPTVLAPVWHRVEVPIVGAVLLTMGQAVAIAIRPEWVRLRHAVRAASLAVWLGALGLVFANGPWVVARSSASVGDAAKIDRFVFRNGLLIALAFLAVSLMWELVGVVRDRRHGSGAAGK